MVCARAAWQERVGYASDYIERYFNGSATASLLKSCDTLPYTIYQYALPGGGTTQVRRAPKVEFYLTNDAGERPLYRWGQTQEFWQAGYPMPPGLCAIAERIYQETGERVNHAIAIGYFDGTQQHAPPHKDKAAGVWVRDGVPTDMARDGSFFVLSLGDPRVFTLQKTNSKGPAPADIVWEKALASGSAFRVSARDNREFYHAVHPQPNAGVRYSIIFRTIATHVPIDAAAAAVANGEAHRFPRPKRPATLDAFLAPKTPAVSEAVTEAVSEAVTEAPTKRPKLDPDAVLAEVDVTKSKSGGATLEAVFQCSRDQSDALRTVGFAWSAADKVLLRLHPVPGATVSDLVAIDALRASYTAGEGVLRARAFLGEFAFNGVNQVCKGEGFSFRKGVGWTKAMGAEAYDSLAGVAGSRSNEAAERERAQAQKEEEIDAIVRAASARVDVMQYGRVGRVGALVYAGMPGDSACLVTPERRRAAWARHGMAPPLVA